MRTALRRSCGWLVFAAALGLTANAHGDARSEARYHFENGMARIADGQFDSGIAALERAYRILPHPAVRFRS